MKTLTPDIDHGIENPVVCSPAVWISSEALPQMDVWLIAGLRASLPSNNKSRVTLITFLKRVKTNEFTGIGGKKC